MHDCGCLPPPLPPPSLLLLQNLSRGCKLWGAVIEVSPRELVVSLPHGLRGHVAYAEASDWLAGQSKAAAAAGAEAAGEDGAAAIAAAAAGKKRKAGTAAATEVVLPPLTDLFTIGQLVRGTVVALRSGSSGDSESAGKAGAKKAAAAEGGAGGAKKKRVDLSLRVSKMNAGLGAPCLLPPAVACRRPPPARLPCVPGTGVALAPAFPPPHCLAGSPAGDSPAHANLPQTRSPPACAAAACCRAGVAA